MKRVGEITKNKLDWRMREIKEAAVVSAKDVRLIEMVVSLPNNIRSVPSFMHSVPLMM